MKMHQYLILCASCGFWTVCYRRKPMIRGVSRIDTICRVCGCRLLRKCYGGTDIIEKPDRWRQYINCYHPGRGGHNKSRSVWKMEAWHDTNGGAEASKRNAEIKKMKALRAGVDLDQILDD